MASAQDISKDMWEQLDNMPMATPPPGVIPDIANRKAHRYPVTIAVSICLPMVIGLAILRIYTKRFILRKWGADDYIFVVSLLAGISLIALNTALIHGSVWGYHSWEVLIGEWTKPVLEGSIAMTVLQGPVTWLVKLALFSLILTAFKPITWLRRLCYIGIVTTGVFYGYFSIYYAVMCGPKGGLDRAAYLAGMLSTKCFNSDGSMQINNVMMGAFSVFSDIYLLVIPLPAIVRLQLPTQRKVGVLVIFLAGLSACSMSMVALKYRLAIFSSKDYQYDLVALIAVITIELSVGMMIPTFATTVTFLRHMNGKYKERLRAKNTSRTSPAEQCIIAATGDVDESILTKYRKIILPNGKTYSQSDTIDKMVYGVNERGFGLDNVASNSDYSSHQRSNDFVSNDSTEKMV